MYCKGMAAFLLIALLFLVSTARTQAALQTPRAPLTPHCVGSGPLPLDPDFCGCTWGVVYYRGQALLQAPVSLHFGNQVTNTVTTSQDVDPQPYYTLIGAGLGAHKGDVMTVTATVDGQTVTRPFRAWPNDDREQEVPLVLPARGSWSPWFTGGYTRTLAFAGNTLWAGGPAGLLAIDVNTNLSVTHTLPWSAQAVVSLAVAANGHIWAAGPHSLAEFDGSTWQTHPPPFPATIRALAVQPATGALWVGGGDDPQGALAVFDGAWHTVTAVDAVVTTLTVDKTNSVWVGSRDRGVYRHAGNVTDFQSGWTNFRIGDGLAANEIRAAAVADNAVWFGTDPPLATTFNTVGSVARYDLATATWQVYHHAHGLPVDGAQQLETVNTLSVDAQGTPWAGTVSGIYRLITPQFWVQEAATNGDAVRALAVSAERVVAAQSSGPLLRLTSNLLAGNPPITQITTGSILTVTQAALFSLTATAHDSDGGLAERDTQILAWDWRADDQPLCTTAEICTMPANLLSPGSHTITLRVQDDEGAWSQPASTTVVVVQATALYLPLIQR